MENENIEHHKRVLEYIYKLKKLEPYMEDKEIFNFVNEDLEEMQEIQKKLQNKRTFKIRI